MLYETSLIFDCNTPYNFRLVELRESSQVMVETTSHSAGRTIPDLKHLLSSWRQRTPNSFEPISVWEDLFLWRFQIFDAITTNFNFSEPGTLATLHDRPWACISLGRTARRQGLKEVHVYQSIVRILSFQFNKAFFSLTLMCAPFAYPRYQCYH